MSRLFILQPAQKVSLYFVSSCSDQRAKTGASLEKRCDKFMRLGLNLSALASKEFQGKQPSLPTGKLGYAQARNPVKQRTAYRTNTNANLCGNVGKLRRQYLVVTSAQIVSYWLLYYDLKPLLVRSQPAQSVKQRFDLAGELLRSKLARSPGRQLPVRNMPKAHIQGTGIECAEGDVIVFDED